MNTLASTMTTLKDVADIWPLIIGGVGLLGYVDRRAKKWMDTKIVQPISSVHRRIDSLDARVHTLEVVHHTEGVDAAEATALLQDRRSDGRRHTDPHGRGSDDRGR